MAKNLLDKATDTVPGFGQMYAKFRQYMLLLQRSEDTIRSYSYRFAHICIRFGRLPDDLTGEQLNDYLEHLLEEDQSHSRSYFKQVVYAIKMYYRFRDIAVPPGLVLPKIKEDKKLPVVLSFDEMRELLRKNDDLRVKSILAMLYSCGMRQSELRRLKLEDIDLARNLVYIKQAKGGKPRCVELGQNMRKVLLKYMSVYQPKEYVFTLEYTGMPIGKHAMNSIIKIATEKAGLTKHITPHTLRHTYATHLLEMGVSLYRLKELMGHASITATMVYLHIIKPIDGVSFSPIDRLFPVK